MWIESGIGDTIDEAVRNFSTRSPRKLFLAHTKVIVLGEKAARHGLHEYLDFLQRFREIRLRTWIVVSEGEASELLQVKPSLETLPTNELVGMFTVTQPDVSKAYVVDLKDFLNTVAGPGIDPVTARMLLTKGPEGQTGVQDDSQGRKSESVRLLGAAVFRGDRLVGFLHDAETMGFLWVKGKVRRGVLPLKGPGHEQMPGKTEKDISIELTRSKSEIVPSLDGEEITVKVKIKAEGDLGEHMETHKITDKLPVLEKLYAEQIKEQVQKVVKKAQSEEYRADIFGFGEVIHRKYPKEWRKLEQNWSTEYFSRVKVILEVEAKIRQTGMISESVPVR